MNETDGECQGLYIREGTRKRDGINATKVVSRLGFWECHDSCPKSSALLCFALSKGETNS